MPNWSGDATRDALRRFMRARDLKVLPWATRAGIRESTLRNFLAGRTDSLTQRTLAKLAAAERVSAAQMLEAPELTEPQRRAAEIAGRLPPEDLEAWLRLGASRAKEHAEASAAEAPASERRPFRAQG